MGEVYCEGCAAWIGITREATSYESAGIQVPLVYNLDEPPY